MPDQRDVKASIGALQSGINKLFDQVWHSGIRTGPFDGQDWAPAIDISERPDAYVVEVELPGVEADEVNVTYDGSTLMIRGQKKRPAHLNEQDASVLSERSFGSFCRGIPLSNVSDGSVLKANLQLGVLIIEVPKEAQTKVAEVQIPINDAS